MVEGDRLEIDLVAPGASVLGFERRARSPDEQARVQDVERWFGAPASWLKPTPGARCRLDRADVDVSAFEPGEAVRAGHADLVASYAFHCADVGRLDMLEVGLFPRFPALERVRAEVVTDRGQGSEVLTSARPTLRLP